MLKIMKKFKNTQLEKIKVICAKSFLLKFSHDNLWRCYNNKKDEKLFITYHKMSSETFFT